MSGCDELEDAFLQAPIARWTAQFYSGKRPISLAVFCAGEFLYNDVWLQIDTDASELVIVSDDVAARTKALQRLLEAMLNFYKNNLDQVLVLKLPDVLTLAQFSDLSRMKVEGVRQVVSELTSLLLLLLGCAVQCERKEDFVTSIKNLDVPAQHALMESIQQIADNPGAVWPREGQQNTTLDEETMYTALVDNVRRLTDERDSLAAQCIQLTLDAMTLKERERDLQPPPSPVIRENSGLTLELADTKSRLRRLQHDYEEKIELLSEVKEECGQLKESLQRLRQDNLQLVQESRCAKALRDEIDILKERCSRYETIELTVQKYKEKISDLEFLRSRCEELKEDLRVTTETKHMLEEQLDTSRKKLETLVSLESELVSLKVELSEAHLEKDLAGERLHRLAEENSQLHVDKKNLVEEISRLQLESSHRETDDDEHDNKLAFEGPSLLEQMHNDTISRCNQLELERERLSCALQEKERDTDKLQADVTSLNLNVKQLQRKLEIAQADSTRLQETEHQLNAVSLEKARFQRQTESLEKRLEELQSDLSGVNNENARLSVSLTSLKGTVQRLNQLEKEKAELESRAKGLDDDRRAAERELHRARQSVEEREQEVDSLSEKFTQAQKELAELKEIRALYLASKEQLAMYEANVHALTEQLSIEKAALIGLRQEMIQEKVKNGLLENELEQIHIQLDNTERQNKEQLYVKNHTSLDAKSSTTEEYLSTASSLVSGAVGAQDSDSTTLSPFNVPVDSDNRLKDNEVNLENSTAIQNGELAQGTSLSSSSSASALSGLRHGRDVATVCNGPFSLPASGLELQSGTLTTESVTKNCGTCVTPASLRVADLKDKIVQLEQKKQQSDADYAAVRKQLSSVKQQLLNAEYEIAQEVAKREALAKQNAALQSHFARLEVDQSVAISAKQQLLEQAETLKQELAEVKSKLREKEIEVIRAVENKEKVTQDYQNLDALHKQLCEDFEAVSKALAESKHQQKSFRSEIFDLRQQVAELNEKLNATKEELKEKTELASSMELLQSFSGSSPAELAADNSRLKDDLSTVQSTYKQLKEVCNQQSIRITQLQGQLQNSHDDRTSREVELSRLSTSYQMLQHINQVLEEERKSLLVKVTSLMASYDQHFGRLLDVISACDNSQGSTQSTGVESYEQDRLRMEEERRLLEDKLSEYTSKLDNHMFMSRAISSRSSTPLITATSSEPANGRAPTVAACPVLANVASSPASSRTTTSYVSGVPLQSAAGLPLNPVHVSRTFENHTTVNVVSQVHHYPPVAVPAVPATSYGVSSAASPSSTAAHTGAAANTSRGGVSGGRYSFCSATAGRRSHTHSQDGSPNTVSFQQQLQSSCINPSQTSSHHSIHAAGGCSSSSGLFRTTLRREAVATGGTGGGPGSLSDADTPSRRSAASSSAVASPVPSHGTPTTSGTPPTSAKQDVWYEYGCV